MNRRSWIAGLSAQCSLLALACGGTSAPPPYTPMHVETVPAEASTSEDAAAALRQTVLAVGCPDGTPEAPVPTPEERDALHDADGLLDVEGSPPPLAPEEVRSLRLAMRWLVGGRAEQAMMRLMAHYRRGLSERPFVQGRPEIVDSNGRVRAGVTRGEVRALAAANDPALLPLLVDALEEDRLGSLAVFPLGTRDGYVEDPALIPAVAQHFDTVDGDSASGFIGQVAAYPASHYVHAALTMPMSAKALGWMWLGHRGRTPHALLAVYVAMLHDDREMGEVGPEGERTLEDRAIGSLATWSEVAELQEQHADRPSRDALVEAWREWAQSCDIEPVELILPEPL